MKSIQIHIPDEIARTLKSFSGNLEGFILDSLRERLQRMKNKKTEQLLIEGYKASKKEAKDLKKDFEKTDINGWDDY